MYWDDDNKRAAPYVPPDDIVDLAFAISCRCLPLDHAYALSQALREVLPWLAEDPGAGVHLIHGAESGNGWYRPQDAENELLYLSRRTRLTLRVPKGRLEAARALEGRTLDLDGYALEVGSGTLRPLSTLPTLFARYVVAREDHDEQQFLESAMAWLKELDISARKMLSGRAHPIHTPDGELFTRSLMVAELDPEQSVRLQQTGVGPGRAIGCGLFIAHKGIAAVGSGPESRG
ncbi:MAG: type I-MYXAN CRISPR-associated protein Cas6/Cmx6 [Gammaproteobacteria bacterium]